MPTLSTRIAGRLSALAQRLDAPGPTAPTREDAGFTTTYGTTSGISGAALTNALSGVGSARDSGATARPNTQREYLSPEELVALMRGSVCRRLVELTPRWATLKGFTITDDTDEKKPLADAFRRIAVRDTVRRADTWGRALGESLVLIVTDDPAKIDQPIVPKRVRRVHRLEVLDRREFTPIVFEGDVSRGPLGEPLVYQISPRRSAMVGSTTVHASRVLRFYGDALPPSETGWNTWGWGADSVVQAWWDGVRNLAGVSNSGARVAEELAVSVFKMATMPGKQAGDESAAFLARALLVNLMRSVVGSIWIGPQDSYERVSANATGYRDLSEGARYTLALLTGHPNALLFGEAPGGLNTDGQSWITNWHSNVGAHREERYRDPIERLIEILYYSETGGVPEKWALEFPALGDISETGKAALRLSHTQADSAAILDGVLTAEEARSRYTEAGGYQLELQPVEIAPTRAALPPPDPAAEESARLMVEAAMAPKPPKLELVADRTDATPGHVWIGAVLPEPAKASWQEARRLIEVVSGALEDTDDEPHVTVIYMGEVDPTNLAEVLAIAREVAARVSPSEACAEHAKVFPPGEGSEGRWPVVLDVAQAWGLWDLQSQLLPRLAHLITARQFPSYRAHLTLGYAADLTPEQQAGIAEVELPEAEWMIGGVQVRYGGVVIATLPLAGRIDRGS